MPLKPYPKYKPSNVDYFGNIPNHWGLIRVKYVALFAYGDSLKSDSRDIDSDVPVYGSNGIVDYHSNANTSAPCLIIGRKGSFGKINYSEVPCFAIDTTFYIDEHTSNVNLRWLFYALQPLELDSYSQDAAVPGLSREFAHSQWLPKISVAEQQVIANFLDRETAVIDTLIAKKRELIERLKEKRTALISHAVTKGLDPTVPMKDSGVEWLGEIPADWQVLKLKYIGSASIGLIYSPNDIVSEEEGTLVLRASNIQNARIVFDDNVYVNTNIPSKLRTKIGDILICSRSGSRDLIGKNALIDQKSVDLSFGAFMTIFRSDYNQYLFYVFNSDLFKFQSSSFLTSTINQLTLGNLNNLLVPFPPMADQLEIIESLNHRLKILSDLVSKAEQAIERLREYRTALISAAVTGKIDVRQSNKS